MSKKWTTVTNFVVDKSQGWKKLTRPTVSLHKTAFPQTSKDQQNLGIRFDFAGTVEKDGKKFHKFQAQVNAGDKIPTSWKTWRQSHSKGTHGIVATIEVPDGGTAEDVRASFDDVKDDID
ncbi:hypothetical protein FH972_023808 [Carpinus fangiana]|uniref:Uncharacterized protein n=1 Tax=Carpinus fangiana TaxID=176857 RepID=A0A5N6KW88_9ROSI|nr:hypothetical protein FH972_023808 [Carpinus fangiana]